MNAKEFVKHVNVERRRGKMSDYEIRAAEFAFEAHKGQFRKFNAEPYICHPAEVASIVSQVSSDPDTLAAAWLHDVVEDCDVTMTDIVNTFSANTHEYLFYLTNVSQTDPALKKLSRAARKDADARHIFAAPKEAKTVKLADILSNINSLVYNDPQFARVWVKEKAEMVRYLEEGDINLYFLVKGNILHSMNYLNII